MKTFCLNSNYSASGDVKFTKIVSITSNASWLECVIKEIVHGIRQSAKFIVRFEQIRLAFQARPICKNRTINLTDWTHTMNYFYITDNFNNSQTIRLVSHSCCKFVWYGM